MDSLLQDSIRFSSNASELTFDSSESFFQMFFYLLFVLGLIFLIAFGLKKMGIIQTKIPKKISSNLVDILGQFSINQTEKIIAIKVMNSVQILYATQNAIQLLKEIDYEEFKGLGEDVVYEKPFKSILTSVLNRGKK